VIEVTPSYQILSGSIYGEDLHVTDGDLSPLSLEPNKTKEFSVLLPKVTNPGDYFLNFTLANESYKSNTVSASFNIKGSNAKVLNLSLDKDYYEKGETALLKLSYMNYNVASLSAEVTILKSRDKACSAVIKEDLSDFKPIVDISVPLKSRCINPQVFIKLVDANGVVYAEKYISVTTATPLEKEKETNNILFIIIPLVIIFLAIAVIKTKKNNNTDSGNTGVPMGMLAIGFILLSLIFVSNNKAEAAGFISVDPNVTNVNLTLSKDVYSSKENIVFTGGATIKPLDMKIGDDPGDVFGIKFEVYIMENYGSGYVSTPGATGNGFYGVSGSIKADSDRGPDNVYLAISYSYYNTNSQLTNKSIYFSLPYTVRKIGLTVNKVSTSPVAYNSKDTIYWDATDAVKCTACTMTNSKVTNAPCPGFLNNPAPRVYGWFQTDNLTENTTFNITCDDENPPVVIITNYSCQGNVVGSCSSASGDWLCPGPYEGQSCSQFTTFGECTQDWESHGCKWQAN
jgi:hypothetical protein